ncbi:MAG: helix-turn-helix transcriptional regulator [Rhodobacteraceae bacterium]|nr:helix-turn-helix transcriptional regulator [Paracoccaceae bacterium]
MSRTTQINPDRLIALLDRCPISQKELAADIGIDVGTLSRWKRLDKPPGRLRGDKLAKLCDALGTTPTELCSDGPLPEAPKGDDATHKGQVTMVLDTACRNSLALVARRYGVTRQQIVEVAPLLFAVMAEQSIAERREQLQKFSDALGNIENSAPPHLRNSLRSPWDSDDQEILEAEKRSIDARDLFASHVGTWDANHSKDNPFARFLRKKLIETGLPNGKTVTWGGDDSPRYMLGAEELVEFFGRDTGAWLPVLNGDVALAEMPREIRKATPERRASWVKEKSALNAKEIDAAAEELRNMDFKSIDWREAVKLVNGADEQANYDF